MDVELRDIPRRLDDLRGDVQRLEAMLARERTQLTDAETTQRSQSEQIGSSNDALTRAKQKGAKARNAREVEAAEREMDIIRRTQKEREEEQVKLVGAIDKVRASLAAHELEFEQMRAMLVEEEAKGRARMADLEAQRKITLVGRDEVVALLPRDLVARYDRLREKRGSGVAVVTDATCSACRMSVRPQAFLTLQRGDSIEECSSCMRVLLYKPLLDD